MSRRTRATFLLSVGTVLNLFAYLYITGSWKMFFLATPKKVGHPKDLGSDQKLEQDLSRILHEAVDLHKLSPKNVSSLVARLLPHEPIGAGDNNRNHSLVGEITGQLPVGIEHVLVAGKNESQNDSVIINGKKSRLSGASNETKPVIIEAAVESVPDKPKGKIMQAVDNFLHGKETPPVNPHNFNYKINEPKKCFNPDGSEQGVFLLVLICTIHKNFENRNAIRTSWGSPTNISGQNIITMFLLAERDDEKLQSAVMEESEQYHDIIMEDFVDTYKNLTLKTIMGMKWMAMYCPQAKYVMKTDDDMYVSYSNLIKYLGDSPDSRFATGMVINGRPIRDPKSKWYMPKDLFAGTKYPPFCSGTGYAMSGDVPPMVYQKSLTIPYLYLEDVFFAFCLDKLKIVPKNHREFHNWRTTYTFCHYKRILTAHMVTPTQMVRYWNDQKSTKHKC